VPRTKRSGFICRTSMNSSSAASGTFGSFRPGWAEKQDQAPIGEARDETRSFRSGGMAKPAKGSVELYSMEWLAEVCRDEASFPRRHHPLAVAAKVTRAQPGRSFDKLGISGRPFSTIGSSARRRTNRVFQSYDDILDRRHDRGSVAPTPPPNGVCGSAIGRGNWTFAGSDAGGHGAAVVPIPIETCELSNADPPAWRVHLLAKPRDRPPRRRDEWPPWNWTPRRQAITEAA
jgi:hypothetical protein